MTSFSFDAIVKNYNELLVEHGEGPAVAQISLEGQRSRFEKLASVGDLAGMRILDVGCGLGDMYPYLLERFGAVQYTGVDIVPSLIETAKIRRPNARFICRDIIQDPLMEKFDYVLISGIFNNSEIPSAQFFIRQMISAAYSASTKALAFNFISSHVNFRDPNMAYFDPSDIFEYCLENLGKKIVMSHHYEKCDVAFFVHH